MPAFVALGQYRRWWSLRRICTACSRRFRWLNPLALGNNWDGESPGVFADRFLSRNTRVDPERTAILGKGYPQATTFHEIKWENLQLDWVLSILLLGVISSPKAFLAKRVQAVPPRQGLSITKTWGLAYLINVNAFDKNLLGWSCRCWRKCTFLCVPFVYICIYVNTHSTRPWQCAPWNRANHTICIYVYIYIYIC